MQGLGVVNLQSHLLELRWVQCCTNCEDSSCAAAWSCCCCWAWGGDNICICWECSRRCLQGWETMVQQQTHVSAEQDVFTVHQLSYVDISALQVGLTPCFWQTSRVPDFGLQRCTSCCCCTTSAVVWQRRIHHQLLNVKAAVLITARRRRQCRPTVHDQSQQLLTVAILAGATGAASMRRWFNALLLAGLLLAMAAAVERAAGCTATPLMVRAFAVCTASTASVTNTKVSAVEL